MNVSLFVRYSIGVVSMVTFAMVIGCHQEHATEHGSDQQAAAPSVEQTAAAPAEGLIGGFLLGPQAYSFNRFTFFEAIDKAIELGCSVIEAYPGQKLSPEKPDVVFDHNADPAVLAEVKQKLDSAGIKMLAYGVVGLGNDEAANRKVFDFAKEMGVQIINTEPEEGSFPLIEKLVKEYDIKVGIHNHPKQENNPNYKYWDPSYVLACVKDLDPRIGSCADTGHWLRSGVNPLEALQILNGRIISSHFKDLDSNNEDVPFGTGVADTKALLDELVKQGFNGTLSLEYERNWENNVPDMLQCVEFVRNYAQ